VKAAIRVDQALVERGLCESREKAKRAVLAGQVQINQQRAHKPSDTVFPKDEVSVIAAEKYVSRGGHKLEHALDHFQLDVTGLTAVDVGASTGGFTDCLLQSGAGRVYAVDVGRGQLAWRLRQDPRVTVMEGVNGRYLGVGSFPPPFSPVDLVVMDCSFISLKLVLPPAVALLKISGKLIGLIKPQFEAGKDEVGKGAGVIRDPEIHRRVIEEIQGFVSDRCELRWRGFVESPILGPAGNKEFLALIEKVS